MTVLVGRRAPDFTTQAVLANGEVVDSFNFAEATAGKYAVVFFYPMDFTFVCPTELIAMDKRIDKLKSLGVVVVGVSIDSHWTHNAWRNTAPQDGGIGPVRYTLAADMDHSICRAYGVESDGGDSHYPPGVAMRGTFIIDADGIVRHMTVNDEPLGRNMDEVIRTVQAYQHFKENGRVCHAGWMEGDDGFVPGNPDNVASFLSDNASDL
jgi:peroxiredoxin (alkyl hydroperoxide reductase subunit C)